MAVSRNTRSNSVVLEDSCHPIDEKTFSRIYGENTMPLSSSSSSPSTIHLELQQLRGELFDISDTNSSVAIILTKVQQLAKFENRIVEEQRLEIERLSCELNELRIQQSQRRTGCSGLESMPSFDKIAAMVSSNSSTTSSSLSSSSSSSSNASGAGNTNESERMTSYSLFANEKLANAEMNYSKEVVRELEEKMSYCAVELEGFSKLKKGIVNEIEELKDQLQSLVKERNKLMQQVEVYTHQSELAIQLECAQKENIRLQHVTMDLRAALDTHMTLAKKTNEGKQQIFDNELQYARRKKCMAEEIGAKNEERARTEEIKRSELESEMQPSCKENITLHKELEGWKLAKRDGGTATSITTLGEEGQLRFTANQDCKTTAALNNEIQSITFCDNDPTTGMECQNTLLTMEDHSASRKRTLVISQGSEGDERTREFKRHHERPNITGNGCLELIDGSTRVRSYTGGSDTLDGDTVSAMNDADSVSLLFGSNSVDGVSRMSNPNSIKTDSVPYDDGNSIIKSTDDHDVIRAHAEKVLYWANRATERSKSGRSQSSIIERGGDGASAVTPKKREASSPSSSPIPQTIGLPPRSQTRVRKSSQLPPRCPSSTSAVPTSTTSSSSSSGDVETLDCISTSSSSDKENGGSSFNREVLGAFPTWSSTTHCRHQQQKKKNNTSVVDSDTIICNLRSLSLDEEKLCCECSASPFSGNDPLSEFYLPKLGLACNCAGSSVNEERECFSKNPTALSNILRPWQCAFLATLSITTADELLNAHRAGANKMARKLKNWRAMGGMTVMRSRECYVALEVWSRTCKVVLRSIREQKEQARRRRSKDHRAEDADEVEDIFIEKPHFLDISFADMHTVTSISTLGQISRETMEI